MLFHSLLSHGLFTMFTCTQVPALILQHVSSLCLLGAHAYKCFLFSNKRCFWNTLCIHRQDLNRSSCDYVHILCKFGNFLEMHFVHKSMLLCSPALIPYILSLSKNIFLVRLCLKCQMLAHITGLKKKEKKVSCVRSTSYTATAMSFGCLLTCEVSHTGGQKPRCHCGCPALIAVSPITLWIYVFFHYSYFHMERNMILFSCLIKDLISKQWAHNRFSYTVRSSNKVRWKTDTRCWKVVDLLFKQLTFQCTVCVKISHT